MLATSYPDSFPITFLGMLALFTGFVAVVWSGGMMLVQRAPSPHIVKSARWSSIGGLVLITLAMFWTLLVEVRSGSTFAQSAERAFVDWQFLPIAAVLCISSLALGRLAREK